MKLTARLSALAVRKRRLAVGICVVEKRSYSIGAKPSAIVLLQTGQELCSSRVALRGGRGEDGGGQKGSGAEQTVQKGDKTGGHTSEQRPANVVTG